MSPAHIHGGSPQSDMERLGIPVRPVIDFSVNLNPLGPPDPVRENWDDLFQAVEHYPSVEGDGVSLFYRRMYGIGSDNFLAGNGSTELIYLIPRVLGFRRAAVFTPCFHDYERASLLAGAEVSRCPLSPDDGFAFPGKDEMTEILAGMDAVWIGRPNNPTGNLFSRGIILDLARTFSEKWFIVDEAFIQFIDDWRKKSLVTVDLPENIVVLNSLTKFYGVPGLRLGGLVGNSLVVGRLGKAKEPWTVNGIADRVAPILARCGDYEDYTRALVKEEMKRVFAGLDKMEGVVPFPGKANFILCQWLKTDDLDDLLAHLLANGMYVRDCRNFPGLGENFFRVGLRSPGDNARLLSIISSFEPRQHSRPS